MGVENLPSQTLGQYDLKELLGVGGMGVVYRAYQRNLEREVAFKVLSLSLAGDPEYIKRFYREARTAGSLEHPHIVPIYDFGSHDNTTFIVMRILTGGSLAERLKQSDTVTISLGEAAKLLRQLANALDYAHKRNIVHRDIKSNNIMFDTHGNPYLVDFGLAKILEGTDSFNTSSVAMGTPSYMAPEQWHGEPCTPLTDQYALGVTLYELITGSLPFKSPSLYTLMNLHLNEMPLPLDSFRNDTPTGVTLALHRAMLKNPKDRYPSVIAFAQAFATAIRGIEGRSSRFFSYPLSPKDPTLASQSSSALLSQLHLSHNPTVIVSDSQPVKRGPVYRRRLVWPVVAVMMVLVGLIIWQTQFAPANLSEQPTPSVTGITFADGTRVGVIDSSETVNVRGGPGTGYNVVSTALPNTNILILGENADGTWFNIQLPNGSQGWMFAALVDVVSTSESSATP